MSKLLELIQNKHNRLSAIRCSFCLWMLILLPIYGYLSIKNHQLQDLPPGVQYLTGLLISAYLGRNYLENKLEEIKK